MTFLLSGQLRPKRPGKSAGDPAGCPDRPVPGPLRPGRKPAGRPGKPREQEVATLESKGPMGLLYTIAGDKAKRLDEPADLRKAGPTTNRHPGTWPRPRSIWPRLSVPWNRWPAVTAPLPPPGRPGPQPSKPLTCPKAASYVSWKRPLPRGKIGSNVSPICAPSAVPSWTRPGKPSRLAERVEQFRTPSTLALLQDAADLTVQQQQKLDQNLTALLTGMEERQTQLEQTLDDLLAQDLFPSPVEEAFPD